MKGFRFFLEYASAAEKRKGTVKAVGPHIGTVIALELGPEFQRGRTWDCVASVYDRANSPVATSSVERAYLSEKCRRIPEATAREIHPQLFACLDAAE